ncbi:MAG: phosphatidylserine/phosphatidylglycerophosphate/cardiolipin synthase family protein [Verrucomicrobiota bacterium]
MSAPNPPTLLHDPTTPATPAAIPTFERVLKEIAHAQSSIKIHMYVWRNDTIGNQVGQALLEAADRGVKIHILKDNGAIMYERIEMNQKSFFHTDLSNFKALSFRLMSRSFPDTYVKDEHTPELGQTLANHPNVSLTWIGKTHTKYYLFDNERLLTGSINIEDRHTEYLDYMIALDGRDHIDRFHSRLANKVSFDPERPVDFLCNTHHADGAKTFEIKPALLAALNATQSTLYIEMAYLGDDDITRAIIAAAHRGVQTTILFSREANIGNDINYRTIHRIASQAPVEVYLTPRMIHSKLIRFDDTRVITGSCNLSVFSLQKAGELNLNIQNHPDFFRTLDALIQSRLEASQKVTSPDDLKAYNPFVAALQQLHQKWNPN